MIVKATELKVGDTLVLTDHEDRDTRVSYISICREMIRIYYGWIYDRNYFGVAKEDSLTILPRLTEGQRYG